MISYLVEYEFDEDGIATNEQEFDDFSDAVAFAERRGGIVYCVRYEEVDRELVLSYSDVDRSTNAQEE